MTAPEAARHLLPATRQMLELKDAQRIQSLRVDRWIDYPRASEALARLQRLLETPRRERMPCMLLHGPSDIGKTLIIAKFVREHPPTFDEHRGTELRPVITMQMPPTPDQSRFYRALFDVVGVPQGPQATLASLEQVARDILRRMVPQLLVVDEVHHLLAGSAREQRVSLNLLKYLANELRMSVVAAGTNDAPVAFQSDAQIHSRSPRLSCPVGRRARSSVVSWVPLKLPCPCTKRRTSRSVPSFSSLPSPAAACLARLPASSWSRLKRPSPMAPNRSHWPILSKPLVNGIEARWPCVPRPFPDEPFGSWFGRIAGRYRLTVVELAQAAGLHLNFGESCGAWLSAQPPRNDDLDHLSWRCGLSPQRIDAMRATTALTTLHFRFCFRCLFLNDVEVESPYWHAMWLDPTGTACIRHPAEWSSVRSTALRKHLNMRQLTNIISRRHARQVWAELNKQSLFSRASTVRRYR